MAELILPQVEEPNVSVEQIVTNSGAEQSVDAIQPGVVMGVLNVSVYNKDFTNSYTGSLFQESLPAFEVGYKVYDNSTFKPVLKNITVGILGTPAPVTGVISQVSGKTYLTVSEPGLLKGVVKGDLATVIKPITDGTTGTVDVSDPAILTESSGTQFASVIPGDILTINSVNYEVLSVGSSGASITVGTNLPIGTNITWAVKRNIETNVLSLGVTDTTASQVELDSDIDAGTVTFSLERALVITGTVDNDQPLSTNLALTSSVYSIIDGIYDKNTLQLNANIAIDGFANFTETFTASATISTNTLTITGDLTSNTDRLAAGDVIFFTDNSNNKYARTVVSVTANSANTDVVFSGTALTAALTAKTVRSVYKALTGTVGGAGYVYEASKSLNITKADIEISYRARATADSYKVLDIAKVSDLEKLGELSPDNHLRTAAQIMKANAGINTVYAIIVEDESLASYARGLEAAEGSLLYSVVPLSQSFSVASSIKTHVDSMSSAVKCKWRVGFINLKTPVEDYVVTTTKSGILSLLNVNTSGTTGDIFLIDTKANFSGVKVGDYIKAKQQDGVASTIPGNDAITQSFLNSTGATRYERVYKVTQVVNSTKVKVHPLPYLGSAGSYVQTTATLAEGTGSAKLYVVTYEVIKILNRDEQSQAIGNIAKGFSDRRFNYVPNETCIIEFTRTDGTTYDVEMPGYMLCAALAGVVTNTFPHQPLTRVPLVGIKGVRGGREMFNSTQLSVQATGGAWIIVQDVLDKSAPYSWRQMTTSQGGLKEQEFSFTKNLDEISYALYYDHQRFPGRNNRVKRTAAAIEAQTRATLEGRKITERNSITGGDLGSQIIDYKLGGVIEDPLLLDTYYSDITLELPLPLNSIKFRVAA